MERRAAVGGSGAKDAVGAEMVSGASGEEEQAFLRAINHVVGARGQLPAAQLGSVGQVAQGVGPPPAAAAVHGIVKAAAGVLATMVPRAHHPQRETRRCQVDLPRRIEHRAAFAHEPLRRLRLPRLAAVQAARKLQRDRLDDIVSRPHGIAASGIADQDLPPVPNPGAVVGGPAKEAIRLRADEEMLANGHGRLLDGQMRLCICGPGWRRATQKASAGPPVATR